MLKRYQRNIAAFGRLAWWRLKQVPRHPWRFALTFIALNLTWLGGNAAYELYNAAQQRNASYDYQPASHARFPHTVKGKAQSGPYEPNCKQPQSNENADLCAQWAGVAQVTETNRLASLSLQLSLGALIATMFGTALLVWTLHETRQTARRELRAYVSVGVVGLEFTLINEKAFAHIKLTNGGQTPAYQCCHNGSIFAATDEEAEQIIMRSPHTYLGRAQPFTLHMNAPQGGSLYAHQPITLADLKEIVEGDKWLYVFGTVFYQDTFGIDRRTRFCVKSDDLDLPSSDDPNKWPRGRPRPTPAEWFMAPFHNDAT